MRAVTVSAWRLRRLHRSIIVKHVNLAPWCERGAQTAQRLLLARALSAHAHGPKEQSSSSFANLLNKMKGGGTSAAGTETSEQPSAEEQPQHENEQTRLQQAMKFCRVHALRFWNGLVDTSRELFNLEKPSRVKQRIVFAGEDTMDARQAANDNESTDTEERGDPNAGTAIILVKDKRSYWERLTESLKDAPIIQNLRETGRLLSKTDLGQRATEVGSKLRDKVSDAREYWETTQNPVVVSVSSVWDSMTRETDQAIAIKELRRLDPHFTLEEWTDDVAENLVPMLLKAHLRGDTRAMKPWLGEALFNKLRAEIQQRKAERIELDQNLLAVEDPRVLSVLHEEKAGGSPIIVIQVMTQQITCVRKDGEIIEGAEDNIQAYFYVLAFQREYNEKDAVLQWRVVDMLLSGKLPYLV